MLKRLKYSIVVEIPINWEIEHDKWNEELVINGTKYGFSYFFHPEGKFGQTSRVLKKGEEYTYEEKSVTEILEGYSDACERTFEIEIED